MRKRLIVKAIKRFSERENRKVVVARSEIILRFHVLLTNFASQLGKRERKSEWLSPNWTQ